MPLMWIKLQMKLKAGQYGSNDLKPMQERLRPDNMRDNAAATSDRASYSDYECVNIHQQPNNLNFIMMYSSLLQMVQNQPSHYRDIIAG